jgi:hypothetical protein
MTSAVAVMTTTVLLLPRATRSTHHNATLIASTMSIGSGSRVRSAATNLPIRRSAVGLIARGMQLRMRGLPVAAMLLVMLRSERRDSRSERRDSSRLHRPTKVRWSTMMLLLVLLVVHVWIVMAVVVVPIMLLMLWLLAVMRLMGLMMPVSPVWAMMLGLTVGRGFTGSFETVSRAGMRGLRSAP